jgi:hypothetical protein
MSAFTTLIVAIASAVLGYLVSNIREKQTNWRNLKIELYRTFIIAHSGMADGDATDKERFEFSRSCNSISLVASRKVLDLLNAYLREISISNRDRRVDNEINLRRKLIWEMRKDLGYLPARTSLTEFDPPFQTSGNRINQDASGLAQRGDGRSHGL